MVYESWTRFPSWWYNFIMGYLTNWIYIFSRFALSFIFKWWVFLFSQNRLNIFLRICMHHWKLIVTNLISTKIKIWLKSWYCINVRISTSYQPRSVRQPHSNLMSTNIVIWSLKWRWQFLNQISIWYQPYFNQHCLLGWPCKRLHVMRWCLDGKTPWIAFWESWPTSYIWASSGDISQRKRDLW